MIPASITIVALLVLWGFSIYLMALPDRYSTKRSAPASPVAPSQDEGSR